MFDYKIEEMALLISTILARYSRYKVSCNLMLKSPNYSPCEVLRGRLSTKVLSEGLKLEIELDIKKYSKVVTVFMGFPYHYYLSRFDYFLDSFVDHTTVVLQIHMHQHFRCA